ncbi:MAG: dihydrodipicolinate synthase family protein [Pyrinomonadaceae bacterium]|nr:dihydrodipicolinate synthase family protein [Pyrinomonadaceae bacterium]
MRIDDIIGRLRPRRKVQGIAAALLPFNADGSIAVGAFQKHVRATHQAGLINAVNMDTGYVKYLTEAERLQVLQWSREALGTGITFVAGAYIEGLDGDVVSLYRQQIDQIVAHGGIPIIFQTARLLGRKSQQKINVYRGACRGYQEVLGFELDPVFAPNGEIFDDQTVRGLLEIPELKGLKHSSLDRLQELQRLALRDAVRPDFRIYSGNDLGINMIEYGSDYLLGLATFAPDKFAERDLLWETGEPAYYELSDSLQHLGNVAFRAPVPAYKHSAATFLHLRGLVPSPRTHPRAPVRPAWEADILRDCAERLGYSSSN